MRLIPVDRLEGRALDYAVALAVGHRWAKNLSPRSGDSYRREGTPEGWPIGSRCLVSPNEAKDLVSGRKNWAGYGPCNMTEPIAPRAFQGMPRFSMDWGSGGPLIERFRVALDYLPDKGHRAYHRDKRLHQRHFMDAGRASTSLVVAMRCVVAVAFNATEVGSEGGGHPVFAVPEELLP